MNLGEDGCRCVAVSSECFVQLLQPQQHRSLMFVLPQGSGPDQPAVVIQRPAEPTAEPTAVLHLLLGLDPVTFHKRRERGQRVKPLQVGGLRH